MKPPSVDIRKAILTLDRSVATAFKGSDPTPAGVKLKRLAKLERLAAEAVLTPHQTSQPSLGLDPNARCGRAEPARSAVT
jgi:hypothetical protein